MLKFIEQPSGASAISSATERSLKITTVTLYTGSTDQSFTDFSGATFLDTTINDNYFVIKLNDYSDSAYTATKIILKDNSNTVIAESETISIIKTSSNMLNLRVAGILVNSSGTATHNANKLGFNSTISGVPYATSLREGLVRLARGTTLTTEPNKSTAVYTAAQTDAAISAAISGDIDLSGYIRWDADGSGGYTDGDLTTHQVKFRPSFTSSSNEVTISADSNGLTSNKPLFITDTSVPSYGSTTIATSAISDTTRSVNGNYIADLYSNSVDTAATETDSARKLVTSHAVRAYVEAKDALVVHTSGNESITGIKTFSNNIVANGTISGGAVYNTYADGTWSSGHDSELPTVSATKSAINATKSDLQSQIDALNAGQNLADIVADRSDLASLPITDLKARGDTKPSGGTWAAGDKVQVLSDNAAISGSTVSTVYELVKGTKGDSPDIDSATTGYYWEYIGLYGSDSYTKSEIDDLLDGYLTTSTLTQTVNNGSTTTTPSEDAVYDFVTGFGYAPLTGTNTFSGTSNTFTNAVTAGSISSDSISGKFIVSGTAYAFNTAGSLSYITSTSLTGAADTNVATSLAVKTYIDNKDSAAVHLTGAETISGVKTFSGNNTFSGTNTFAGITATSISGDAVAASDMSSSTTQIPTATAVKNYVQSAQTTTVSTENAIGSIGLFMYTNPGDQLSYGANVSGAHLIPVGMSLPYTGEIEYKAVLGSQLSGTWKLLSVAFKRTAQAPCLVMAVKVSDS